MKKRIPRWLFLGTAPLLIVAIAALLPGAEKPEKKLMAAHAPTAATPTTPSAPLVWPLPPDPPRIRWVGQISKFSDVRGKKPKKKVSLFERVAGAPKPEDEDTEQLKQPYGIAVDSRGRIFVADSRARAVVLFDPLQKKVDVWGQTGRAPFGLPIGVSVDAEDRVFVSDAKTRAITAFSAEGEIIARFGYRELTRPAGLAIDKSRQWLYVADAKANRVSVFDLKTFTLVKHIGARSGSEEEPGPFLTPTNVTIDRQGKLYVADSFNTRIVTFDRRGKFVRAFGRYGDSPGDFAFPKGIAVDSEGHIYVADARFNNFQIFDEEGRTLLFVGASGWGPGQFVLAAGLYIDGQDRIYVSDFSGRVQIFQYIPHSGLVGERR